MTVTSTRVLGGWRRLRPYSHRSGKIFASSSQSSSSRPLSVEIPSSTSTLKQQRHSLLSTPAGIAVASPSDFRQYRAVLPLAPRQSYQIRCQSDSLKQRAVEALKSKKNDVPPVRRPLASNVSNSGSSSSGSGNSPINPGDGSNSTGKSSGRGAGKGDDDFADGRASSAGASSPRAGGSTLPTDKKAQEADIVENSGVEVNDIETESNVGVANDVSSNSESNPWAQMHLHEFAPKIVVVGVGGAGTNAVNNMVASGLSGKFFILPQ